MSDTFLNENMWQMTENVSVKQVTTIFINFASSDSGDNLWFANLFLTLLKRNIVIHQKASKT